MMKRRPVRPVLSAKFGSLSGFDLDRFLLSPPVDDSLGYRLGDLFVFKFGGFWVGQVTVGEGVTARNLRCDR